MLLVFKKVEVFVTEEQKKIAESASFTRFATVAMAALRSSGHLFNQEQQQRLVDTIARDKNWRIASVVLKDVPQLTENQKTQLRKSILANQGK